MGIITLVLLALLLIINTVDFYINRKKIKVLEERVLEVEIALDVATHNGLIEQKRQKDMPVDKVGNWLK